MTTQANDLLEAGKLAAEAKANPTVRELLARAALELAPDKIKANFPGQPLVQAELLRTIGLTYDAIGDRPAAIDFLTRSLTQYRRYRGPDHPDTLITRVSLGAGYLHAGRLDRALPHLEETLQLLNARLSPDHYGILACLKYLALGYLAYGKPDRALPLYQEVLGRTKAKFGHDHIKTLACMHNLAV
jgi:tetratricopeptide (TPR) repeat protein